jgi:hypothetical protein
VFAVSEIFLIFLSKTMALDIRFLLCFPPQNSLLNVAFGAMTLSIVTLSVMTLSILTLTITKLSSITLSIMTFDTMSLRIMTNNT